MAASSTLAPVVEDGIGTWSEQERQEELATLTESDKEFLRDAAKSSLYILSKGILGYEDLNPQAHKEFCEQINEVPSKRRLWLMPRAHLKSTIKTIAHPIQLVIQDPEYTRILIASETATQAQKFLAEIKRQWENNALLNDLFPALLPKRRSGTGADWSQARASLNREAAHRESHWTTVGVGGAITGGHFSHIINDDLIGLEAYRSPAKMAETREWNDTIEPFLINQNRDFIDWVGTRWAPNDLYEHIMQFYGGSLAVYTRCAIENGEIIFPELHSWEEYERLQTKNPVLWYAQYENNPVSGGPTDLAYDALLPYFLSPDGQEAVITNQDGSQKRWNTRDLDRIVLVDPNSGSPIAPDMAAIVVLGQSPDEEVFTLETWSDRSNPTALVDKAFDITRRWRPRLVGIEKAGQQNTQHYFEKKCLDESFGVTVVPLEPRGRDKEERIRYLMQPVIASGRLFLLPSQTVLRQQIKDFPNNILVDELDACAYGMEHLIKPRRLEDGRRKNRVLRLIMQTRNLRTGY